MNSEAIAASLARMIADFGVRVSITKVDTGQNYKVTGAYAVIKENPLDAGAAVQQQSRMYVAAGRVVPEVGDFIDASGRSARVRGVTTVTLAGKPVVYTLDLT